MSTKKYPIIISKNEEEISKYKYLVYIPDLDGYTQGESIEDAIFMAHDYIEEHSLYEELPEPNTKTFESKENDIVTHVNIESKGGGRIILL